ncbi:response regulator [Asaia astilbis]|uniref:response regulator n=1 Tax=Asaia astilbis TaxID=610244 RepID=UPI00046F9A1F|nr:response regulator [Asaia astilbis]
MTDAPILLVEDDDSIALIVEAILSSAGAPLKHVISAADALAFAAQEPPALLVTDLNLPGEMSGDALARKLRETQPTLPVILISGDFDDSSARDDLVPGAVILPKPFRKAALLEAVEKARAASA